MQTRLFIFRVSAVAAAGCFALSAFVLSASALSPVPPQFPTLDLHSALSHSDIVVPPAPQLGRPPRAIHSYDGSDPVNTFVIHWRPPAAANLPAGERVLKYIIRRAGKPYSDNHDPARCGSPPGNGYEIDPNFERVVAADVFSITLESRANSDCLSWAVTAVNRKGEGAALYTDPVVSTRKLAGGKDCAPGTARPWGGSETRQPPDPPQSANPPVGPFVTGGADGALKAGPQIIDDESGPYNQYRRGCASGHHVEFGDWCHRLNYPHGDAGLKINAKAVWSQSADGETVTGQNGPHFDWFCHIEGSDLSKWEAFHERRGDGSPFHPGGGINPCADRGLDWAAYGHVQPPARVNYEMDLVCAMNDANLNSEGEPRATKCGAFAEYNFQHRECQCRGLADEMTTDANGVSSCGCGADGAVSGADGSCECPAGTVFYPELNACKIAVESTFAAAPGGAVRPGQIVHFAVTVSAASGDPTGRFFVFNGASNVPLPGCDRVELHPSGTSRRRRAGQCAVRLPMGAYELWADYELTNPNLPRVGTAGRVTLLVSAGRNEDCVVQTPWGNPTSGAFQTDALCYLPAAVFHSNPRGAGCGLDLEAAAPLNLPRCSELFSQMTAQGCAAKGLLFKRGNFGDSHPARYIGEDLTCVCPDGDAPPCDDADAGLLAEIRSPNPDMDAVRAHVAAGANANAAYAAEPGDLTPSDSGGRDEWPLLFLAAARGHAEAVSVLVVSERTLPQ